MTNLLKSKSFLLVFVAVVITAIAFSPVFDLQLTNWDDDVYITTNEHISKLDGETISYWFGEYIHGNYHPLTMLSYAFDNIISSNNIRAYHITNWVLHLLSVVFVFLFTRGLTKRLDAAFFTALLFGVHPMHVESVAWISERKDVLYALFFVAGLFAYTEYLQKKKITYLISTTLLFVLSLLSKSAAVVFPVILVLIDIYKGEKLMDKQQLFKVPLFALSIIFGLLAIDSQQATEAIAEQDLFTISQRVMFASYGVVIYIAKFFVPSGLSAFHPYPSLIDGERLPYVFYASPVIVLGVLGAMFYGLKKHKTLFFGIAFYLVSIALVLQFVSVGSAIYAERYTYVAYIGLAITLFQLLFSWLQAKNEMALKMVYGTFVAGFLFFSAITFSQTKTWQNTTSLWTQFNKVYPHINFGHVKLAEYYLDKGEDEKAFERFDYIVKTYPGSSKATMGRGNLYAKKKMYNEAIADYNTALAINPKLTDVYVNRAITYSIMQQYELAFADYNKAIAANPNNYKIRINRGYALLVAKRYKEALIDYNYVLQYEPQNPNILFFVALCHHQLNEYSQAIEYYNKAISLNGNNVDAIFNRGLCFRASNNPKKALQDMLTAQKMGKKGVEGIIAELQNLINS